MKSSELLYLSRADVAALLDPTECIAAVAAAFRAYADGSLPASPGVLATHLPEGGIHVKTAALGDQVVAKVNANFPRNPDRNGLPTVQGLLLLFDAVRGTPLAVMDSAELTALRTAAASAVAARELARPEATSVAFCGCGVQARAHLAAIRCVRPIARVWAYDVDPARAAQFVEVAGRETGLPVGTVDSVTAAFASAEIIVTSTPAEAPFVSAAMLRPGQFVAAVGADNPHKQECEPAVLRRARVVTDLTEQGATMGELHHALTAGVMTRADVHAELGEILAGRRPGRTSGDEIFLFDSTGTALQDVAAASVVYGRALASGRGVLLPR